MKSTWTNILPASVVEQGAADPDFALEHTEEPDPKDADTEVATDHWNLPPVRPWAPSPQLAPDRKPGILERFAEVFR